MRCKKKRDDEMLYSIDAPHLDVPSFRTLLSDKHVESSRNVEALPAARLPDPPDVKPHRPSHIKKRWTVEKAGLSPKSKSGSPDLEFYTCGCSREIESLAL
jgi:hypothetical protein